MKIRSALVPAFALLYASTAYAQDDHKLEVTVDYSYVHANPQNNNVIPTFSLNGGGGGITYYSTSNIGIQAEFQGYGSYTHHFTLPPPFCSGPCTVSAQGNLFTYNVGPIVKFRPKHFEPFVEALFGGAHSNFYANLSQACAGACTVSRSPSNNAFDFIIGGGVDMPLGGHFAVRPAQFDYLLTRFGSAFTAGNNNQSNFRYQAGAQLRF